MIIYLCIKFHPNTLIFSKDIAWKSFVLHTGRDGWDGRTYRQWWYYMPPPPPHWKWRGGHKKISGYPLLSGAMNMSWKLRTTYFFLWKHNSNVWLLCLTRGPEQVRGKRLTGKNSTSIALKCFFVARCKFTSSFLNFFIVFSTVIINMVC